MAFLLLSLQIYSLQNRTQIWIFYCLFGAKWCITKKSSIKIALPPRNFLLRKGYHTVIFKKTNKNKQTNKREVLPNIPLQNESRSIFPWMLYSQTQAANSLIQKVGLLVPWETFFPIFHSLLFYSSESFFIYVYLLTCS